MDNNETPIESFHIGKAIKAELARQGRSITWLAHQIGYTRENLYKIMRREWIYTDVLFKICDALDHDFFKLDRNLSGSELTDSYCIKMVRDYWDCSKGAYFNHSWTGGCYYRRHYDCQSGDRGDLMATIDELFNDGDIEIDVSASYYRNYVLNIEAHGINEPGDCYDYYYLRISF